ncbi:MAG: hypothetical protein HY291_22920 [Planctomycetes bacterium]|nr:hypothetical protein [Planctomycetota bacterium]
MKIVETMAFHTRASELLGDLETWELQAYLALNPLAGKLVQGGRGLRKLRWASPGQGQGKRGGVRVIYYVQVGVALYLVTVYPKSEKEDLSARELAALVKNLEAFKHE